MRSRKCPAQKGPCWRRTSGVKEGGTRSSQAGVFSFLMLRTESEGRASRAEPPSGRGCLVGARQPSPSTGSDLQLPRVRIPKQVRDSGGDHMQRLRRQFGVSRLCSGGSPARGSGRSAVCSAPNGVHHPPGATRLQRPHPDLRGQPQTMPGLPLARSREEGAARGGIFASGS